MVISTAACIAGKDSARIRCLPDTKSIRNEVIILKAHGNLFEQQIRQAGGKVVEIGQARASFLCELEQEINDQTTSIFYFTESETRKGGVLCL